MFCLDSLHLTPISTVQKIRPSFHYIDKSETRATQSAKAKAASNDGGTLLYHSLFVTYISNLSIATYYIVDKLTCLKLILTPRLDSSQDEMEDAKAVTVRFKGAESDISKALREKSYASFEKRIADEKWIPTAFHHQHVRKIKIYFMAKDKIFNRARLLFNITYFL